MVGKSLLEQLRTLSIVDCDTLDISGELETSSCSIEGILIPSSCQGSWTLRGLYFQSSYCLIWVDKSWWQWQTYIPTTYNRCPQGSSSVHQGTYTASRTCGRWDYGEHSLLNYTIVSGWQDVQRDRWSSSPHSLFLISLAMFTSRPILSGHIRLRRWLRMLRVCKDFRAGHMLVLLTTITRDRTAFSNTLS